MKSITDIYTEIYNDDSTKDPKKFISLIESEIDIIVNSDFADYNERKNATILIGDYAINLANVGYIKKAITYLNIAISLFETDDNLKNVDLLDEPLYEAIIWERGRCNFNLNSYLIAKNDFKKLCEKWPDNDRYKNWYNGCVEQSLNKFNWIFASIIIVCIIAKYIMEIKSSIYFYADLISLIGLLSIWLYKIKIKK